MGRKVFLTLLVIATVVCIIVGLCIHTGMFRNGFRIGIPGIAFNEEIKTEVLYSEKDAAGRGNSGVKIPDEITALEISAEIMDVKIVPGEELYVEYTGSETYRPTISAEGSRLIITQKTKNVIGINFSGIDNSLLVKLPEDLEIESFNIGTDTGRVTMESVATASLEIETSTGGVELKELASASTDIRTDTGSVKVENSDLGELSGKTDTGSIELNSCSFGNTDLQTDTGSVEISSLSKHGEYSMDLGSDTGSITVNGEKIKGHYRYDGGKYMIKIETDTGRITLNGV